MQIVDKVRYASRKQVYDNRAKNTLTYISLDVLDIVWS